MNEDKNNNSKEKEERNIVIKKGNYFEDIRNFINGDYRQINIYLDNLKSSKKFWISLITIISIVTFPAYYPLIQAWFIRNSKIEITNYEGANDDKISLIVKNSGRKPGSIGSAWLIIEDLLKTPVRFPFDNGNSINNSDLFLKSGEEKRIILTRPKNWQDYDTSHIAEHIRERVIPCIDIPNDCQQNALQFTCTLNIEVNQTEKVELIEKKIQSSNPSLKWQCLEAIGIFVDIWGSE